MSSLVDFKVVTSGEALVAVRAFVVPLSGMDQLVPLEVTGVRERQLALVALVWLFLGVRSCVRCQVTDVRKLFT